jgi:hypothetical protein
VHQEKHALLGIGGDISLNLKQSVDENIDKTKLMATSVH